MLSLDVYINPLPSKICGTSKLIDVVSRGRAICDVKVNSHVLWTVSVVSVQSTPEVKSHISNHTLVEQSEFITL